MIQQYRFQLSEPSGQLLPSFWAYRLYAWLLEQIPEEYGADLHLQGGKPISQSLHFDREKQQNIWTVNLLSQEIAEVVEPVLEGIKQIPLQTGTLTAEKQSVLCYEKSEELILKARSSAERSRRAELTFLTATSFKKEGRYEIFPRERLILQSLINKWNLVCPEYSLEDEEAFAALEQGLHIVDYTLRSTRFPLKSTKIPGFYGKIVVESHLAAPMEEIWQLLVAFAPFSGVGIKTTLGMGGVICK